MTLKLGIRSFFDTSDVFLVIKHIFDPYMAQMLDFAWPGKWAGEVYSGPKPYIIMKIGDRQFLGMPDGILELQYFLDPHMTRNWP